VTGVTVEERPKPYKNTSHDYAVKLGEGSNTGESVCFYMVKFLEM
jgi:hypothetical protein